MKYHHELEAVTGTNIKQGCSTHCHAAHGSKWTPAYQTPSLNAPCFACHLDKQGPFKHEHAGTKGNCTQCHDPHGTNDAHLLRPDLSNHCATCHQQDDVLSRSHAKLIHGYN
ncbi:hypothetical protein NFHSH190041_04850 [Shewanella sp. NFH-SH190041]|uniref:cytochrome c3 family protein n=1 Tax=Shewanella sp. NFH-SH190041 TaxID=2950245 RepID=UPI0021C399C1|nr:cytochrome c3 family protein [Shewanella sp. NFH-SH190041]BDM63033.1 hypothetical protein NFHSH190041_04850 [Shewanella sp. NFH-SH190041]